MSNNPHTIPDEEIQLRRNAGKNVTLWERVVRPNIVYQMSEFTKEVIQTAVASFNVQDMPVIDRTEDNGFVHYRVFMNLLDGVSKERIDLSSPINRAFVIGAINRHADEVDGIFFGQPGYEEYRIR
ncbi:hypothetical protein CMI45_01720 [Candidatus Pacearchaeota archaeon]|nr:hypothetical protein [Candidatus Pacearchaeota archaeon]|tara:strand:- start:720 stop:1097 length:378 start_codon:yes stop_codon:yes gene_type:complete